MMKSIEMPESDATLFIIKLLDKIDDHFLTRIKFLADLLNLSKSANFERKLMAKQLNGKIIAFLKRQLQLVALNRDI